MDVKYKIGFIGAGNMANAIVSAVLSKEFCKPNEIIVSSRTDSTLEEWKKKGINVTLHNCEIVSTSDITFIAIKPQQFESMVSSLHGDVDKSKIHKFVSVMAGVPMSFIKEKLQPSVGTLEIIRVMPNTPLLVGHGCSVMSLASGSSDAFGDEVIKIMRTGGTCDIVEESQINAVTAVSGSGPCYIYMVIEALADGGVKCGLPRALALKLASQTVVGAGEMVNQTGDHPGLLKDQVCSPGGTTIHAVHALESSGIRSAFMNAVEAAYKRAAQFQ